MSGSDVDCDENDVLQSESLVKEVMKAKENNPGMFVSAWEKDEEDVQEWSQSDILNDPKKQFISASENNDFDTIRQLLNSDASLISACDDDGYTALHRAAYNGHREMVELLLSSGAQLDATTMDGWTVVHSAAFWNKAAVVDLLLRAGANPNVQTESGQTPLHLVAGHNDTPETLQVLLFNPLTNPCIENKMGETSFDLCARSMAHSDLFHCRSSASTRLNFEPNDKTFSVLLRTPSNQ